MTTDRPITIAPQPGRVRVWLAGVAVADTERALRLQEADYAPVLYVPRADVRADCLEPSPRTSHCPHKGDAGYHHLVAGGARRPDAAWGYADPFPAVRAIAGHLAFYPDRVDAIEVA